jgi:CheY-like chemotaxis protein
MNTEIVNKTQTPQKILIIEDEKSLRAALVDILLIKDFEPIEAKNGKEGLKIALREHPELILLDLIMPEMDGMATLQKIRADIWGKKVPIIILTNLSMTNDQASTDIEKNDLTHYLIKSDWKLHDIVKKVEEILGK